MRDEALRTKRWTAFWDLSSAADVKDLHDVIGFEHQVLIAGSPPCTISSLQEHPADRKDTGRLLHASVCTCWKQQDAGRYSRASIRLFFLGRGGDSQAPVRTRCIRNHFSNVLQRRVTASIRQRCKDLEADQVVDQFSELADALDLRNWKQTGQTCYRHALSSET